MKNFILIFCLSFILISCGNYKNNTNLSEIKGNKIDKKYNLGGNYSKDGNNIYFDNQLLLSDYDSFDVLYPEESNLIKDKLYLKNYFNYYAKDKDYVYFNGQKLKNADLSTFKALDLFYAKDKKYFYEAGVVVKNIDPSTVKVLEITLYKDTNGLYCGGKKIEGVNIENVEVIKMPYIKDGVNIFSCAKGKIENVDYNSFEPIVALTHPDGSTFNFDFGRDKNNIYWANKVINNVNKESFITLSYGYSKDINNAYFQDKAIEGVNVSFFEKIPLANGVPGGYYSKDNINIFYESNIITGIDYITFNPINEVYSKDKNNVYFKQKRISNTDINTFEDLNVIFISDENKYVFFGKDKNNYYKDGEIITESEYLKYK